METRYVKAARESGDIEPIVRAGLLAFCKGTLTGGAVGMMLSACMVWWNVLYGGGERDWPVVSAAERQFGFDVYAFMQAIGLA